MDAQTSEKPSQVIEAAVLKARTINFEPVLNDNQACAARIRDVIERAGQDGCDLILFPEMALQGFERCRDCKDRGSACDRHLAGAELADGPLMRGLADVVKRHNMYAVIGFGERDPVKPVIYNAAAMLGPEGLIGTTRKMGVAGAGPDLLSPEDMFAQGQEITVYPTRYGPIGVGICFDMWINPEIPRIMALKGAKILAIPTATVPTTVGGDIEAMAFTRARENALFVISANLVRGGFEVADASEPAVWQSHSYIAGPDFPRMARVLGKTDDPVGEVTATIDLSQYDRHGFHPRRMAGGSYEHISKIVAREYAALAGMRIDD